MSSKTLGPGDLHQAPEENFGGKLHDFDSHFEYSQINEDDPQLPFLQEDDQDKPT